MPDRPTIPLGLKLAYSAFVAVLVPYYWVTYSPWNFLFFCDLALLMTLAALWLESPLLASIPAVGIVLPVFVSRLDPSHSVALIVVALISLVVFTRRNRHLLGMGIVAIGVLAFGRYTTMPALSGSRYRLATPTRSSRVVVSKRSRYRSPIRQSPKASHSAR